MTHAENGNIKGIKAEIANGQDANATFSGRSALFYAVENNQLEAVKVLIKNGAHKNRWALNHAIQNGKLEALKILINNGVYKVHIDSFSVFYGLFDIGSKKPFTDNHIKIIKYLVENGGNIQADPYDAPSVSLIGRITESFCNLYANDEKSNSKALYAIAYLVDKGATYTRSFNEMKYRCKNPANEKRFEMILRNAPAYLARIDAQEKEEKERKIGLSTVQQLLKKQSCSLNTKDWIYIDNKCKGIKAHGTGRAVYKDGRHFFKGKIISGRLVSGQYLENGTTIFEGKFSNNRPHGQGICFYKGDPEECKYYKGKRIDTLYKQRQEITELRRKHSEEIAKLRGEIHQLQRQPTHTKSGGRTFGDSLMDEAAKQGMKKIFDNIF